MEFQVGFGSGSRLILLTALILALCGLASAEQITIILQSNITQDTYLSSYEPTTNFGTGTVMLTGQYGSAGARKYHTILTLKMPDEDFGTITGLTLSLYCVDSIGYPAAYQRRIIFFPMYRNFSETQATWNINSTGSNWATAGGDYNTTYKISQVNIQSDCGSAPKYYNWTIFGEGTINNLTVNWGDVIALELVDIRENYSTAGDFAYDQWTSREGVNKPIAYLTYNSATTTTTIPPQISSCAVNQTTVANGSAVRFYATVANTSNKLDSFWFSLNETNISSKTAVNGLNNITWTSNLVGNWSFKCWINDTAGLVNWSQGSWLDVITTTTIAPTTTTLPPVINASCDRQRTYQICNAPYSMPDYDGIILHLTTANFTNAGVNFTTVRIFNQTLAPIPYFRYYSNTTDAWIQTKHSVVSAGCVNLTLVYNCSWTDDPSNITAVFKTFNLSDDFTSSTAQWTAVTGNVVSGYFNDSSTHNPARITSKPLGNMTASMICYEQRALGWTTGQTEGIVRLYNGSSLAGGTTYHLQSNTDANGSRLTVQNQGSAEVNTLQNVLWNHTWYRFCVAAYNYSRLDFMFGQDTRYNASAVNNMTNPAQAMNNLSLGSWSNSGQLHWNYIYKAKSFYPNITNPTTSIGSEVLATTTTLPVIIDYCASNETRVLSGGKVKLTATVWNTTTKLGFFWFAVNESNWTSVTAVNGTNTVVWNTVGFKGNYSVKCCVNDTLGSHNCSKDWWVMVEPQGLSSQSNQQEWRMFGRDYGRTANSPDTAPLNISNATVNKWYSGSVLDIDEQEVTYKDGVAWINSNYGFAWQLNGTNISRGQLRNYSYQWVDSEVRSSIALAGGPWDTYGYFMDWASKKLLHLNQSMNLVSNKTLAQLSRGNPIINGSSVYVAAGPVYQLSSTNVTVIVNQFTQASTCYGVISSARGLIYAFCEDSGIYALNMTNVSILVSNYTNAAIGNSLYVAADENYVFFGTDEAKFYQFNATNLTKPLNVFTGIGASMISYIAVGNGYVYTGADSVSDPVRQMNYTNISIVHNTIALGSLSKVGAVNTEFAFLSNLSFIFQVRAQNISQVVGRYPFGGVVLWTAPSLVNGSVFMCDDNGTVWQFTGMQATTTTLSPTTTLPSAPQIGLCRQNQTIALSGTLVLFNATTTKTTNNLDTFTVTFNDTEGYCNRIPAIDGFSTCTWGNVGSPVGNYSVKCYVNDTAGLENSSVGGWVSYYTTTTTMPPRIENCVVNQSIVFQGASVLITATVWNASTPLMNFWFSLNETNKTTSAAVNGSNTVAGSTAGLLGNYSVKCLVNDTIGASNWSLDNWLAVVTTTTIAPQISGCTINQSLVVNGSYIYASAIVSNTSNPEAYFWIALNETNQSAQAAVNGLNNLTFQAIIEGNVSVACWVNDTAGLTNRSMDGTLRVVTTTTTLAPHYLLLSNCAVNETKVLNGSYVRVSAVIDNATDLADSIWFALNESNQTAQAAVTGLNNITYQTTAPGNYSIRCWANDSYGTVNSSADGWLDVVTTTTTLSTTTTTIAPKISSCASNETRVLAGGPVLITATVYNTSNPLQSFWFATNETNRTSAAGVNGSNSVVWNTTGFLGNYSITCWINDTIGLMNWSLDWWLDVVTTTTTLPTAPVLLTQNTPANNSAFGLNANINFTANITSNVPPNSLKISVWNLSGALVFSYINLTSTNGTKWAGNWTATQYGNFTWNVFGNDTDGNENTSVSNWTFQVTTTTTLPTASANCTIVSGTSTIINITRYTSNNITMYLNNSEGRSRLSCTLGAINGECSFGATYADQITIPVNASSLNTCNVTVWTNKTTGYKFMVLENDPQHNKTYINNISLFKFISYTYYFDTETDYSSNNTWGYR